MSRLCVFPLLATMLTLPAIAQDGEVFQQLAPVQNPIAAEVADLKDQLEKGLKARRDEEFRFVATVVAMVESKHLPLDLVQSTFLWARKKAKYNRYPFPYFEQALRERAKDLDIPIP